MSTRVLVPIADGSEEIEAVTIVDVLRRAGADVTLASAMTTEDICASRGIAIHSDCLLGECVERAWDLIALPGGMPGADNLHHCEPLTQMLQTQFEQGRWVGAICAAPAVVLGRHGLIRSYRATCHSGFRQELRGYVREALNERVVVDRNLITSQAPGTALAFALQLVTCLCGKEVAETVAEPMAYRDA